MRHRGGEDDASGLLITATASLTPCGKVNRGYLAPLLVGELERDGLLILGELSIHPCNRCALHLVELGRDCGVRYGVGTLSAESVVDSNLIDGDSHVARLVGERLDPIERHALHSATLGLDVYDARFVRSDSAAVDGHTLHWCFGDGEVNVPTRVGGEVRTAHGDALHGGLRHMDRLVVAVACKVVILASVGLDEIYLCLIFIRVRVGEVHLQMCNFCVARPCVHVDTAVVRCRRMCSGINGNKVAPAQGLVVVASGSRVGLHSRDGGVHLAYTECSTLTLYLGDIGGDIADEIAELFGCDGARFSLGREGLGTFDEVYLRVVHTRE